MYKAKIIQMETECDSCGVSINGTPQESVDNHGWIQWQNKQDPPSVNDFCPNCQNLTVKELAKVET